MQNWEYKFVQLVFQSKQQGYSNKYIPPTLVFENGSKVVELPWTMLQFKASNGGEFIVHPSQYAEFLSQICKDGWEIVSNIDLNRHEYLLKRQK